MNSTTQQSVLVPVEGLIQLTIASAIRWYGKINLPAENRSVDILIFNLLGEFWAIPSQCPHQGCNLAHAKLLDEIALLCPTHNWRINIKFSGVRVIENQGQFAVPISSAKLLDINIFREERKIVNFEASKTLELLRDEISKIRLANLKQEKQIHVITNDMDAMLRDSETQKLQLKLKANQYQNLNRFVDRIMDTLDVLLFVIGTDGRILRINKSVERELGYSEKDLLQSPIDQLLPEKERQRLLQSLPILPWGIQSVLLENIRLKGFYSGEHVLLGHADADAPIIYWLNCNLLHCDQGKLEGAVVSALNITELKMRETRLRLSAKVFESSKEAIFITDAQGFILEVNAAFCKISGYAQSEMIGLNARVLKSRLQSYKFYKQLRTALLKQGFWKGEVWLQCKNGANCPMLLNINAVYDDHGELTHYAAISTDISLQKKNEQDLKQLAYYDVLTELPNRFLFRDRVEHEISMAQRNNTRLALFFLDLDHFKNINDTLGHWAGDALLQTIAQRIQGCLRKSDTVARMGGDEFTVILPNLNTINDSTEVARQLVQAIAKPVQIKEHTVFIGASIGIAIFPDDGSDFYALTKHADTAMYAAKTKGRGVFQYFEASMNEAAHQRLLLENSLRNAIERGEFQLTYQPKADCYLQAITGAEALIFWRRDGFGVMPPESFISVAEETALIIPLGNWILKTACLQANIWERLRPGFRIAVNISPRQLMHEDFIAVLDNILAETRTKPECLEFEVTESLVMHNIENATERLQQIRKRGISLAMDDFGTGYSSLSYLQKLPIQTLKIDKSFIEAYKGDIYSNEAAFIKTIVSLGQVLNLNVVAEGIETEAQLNLLRLYGCHEIQGFYLSPPVTAEVFQKRWLEKHI